MLIILTGGNKDSRQKIISKLQQLIQIEVVNFNKHCENRSYIENKIQTNTHKVVVGCFLKSQRYEIYCIARRFNVSYCVIKDISVCDFNPYEEPNENFKYDAPIINENNLESYFSEKSSLLKKKKFSRITHRQKIAPSSDYLMNIKKIIDSVNDSHEGYSFLFKTCEERFLSMVNMNPIDILHAENSYRQILETEIKHSNL